MTLTLATAKFLVLPAISTLYNNWKKSKVGLNSLISLKNFCPLISPAELNRNTIFCQILQKLMDKYSAFHQIKHKFLLLHP